MIKIHDVHVEEKIADMDATVIACREGVDGNVLLTVDESGEFHLVEVISPGDLPLSRRKMEEIAGELVSSGIFVDGARIHFDTATAGADGGLVDYQKDALLADGYDDGFDGCDRIDPSLARRGIDEAAKSLKRRGCDVLQMPSGLDRESDLIIAYDPIENQIVLVDVATRRGYFANGVWTDTMAMRLERIAMLFAFRTSDLPTGDWRYDRISINVQDNGLAMLRHQTNAWPIDGDG